MKRTEFVEEVASKTGLSVKETELAINSILETITTALSNGKSVNFLGFGSFSTEPLAARKVKVPGTDRMIDTPAITSVKFRVGKSLKDAVANT